MQKKNYDIHKEIKPKPREDQLLSKLLQIQDEDADVKRIVEEYWCDQNTQNEISSYNKDSKKVKEAFSFLKWVYKYHEYDRRDGSIVNRVYRPDGSIANSTEEVERMLIDVMKKQQILDNQPKYEVAGCR